MMRAVFFGLVVASAVAIAAPGCNVEEDVAADESNVTSCEGAWIDSAGGCRKPTGKKAKKTCCAAFPAAPTERRNLDGYDCPEGDEKIRVAFFDADSTVRIAKSGAVTANTADDVWVLPLAAPAVAKLNAEGYLVAIVSNQGGVSQGHVTLEEAQGGIAFAAALLHKLGARIDYFDFAEANDEYRKPKTGMATKLDELLTEKCGRGIDLEQSLMVGDSGYKQGVDGPHPDGRPADDFSNSDRLFAENLGVDFAEPTDYFDWRAFDVYNLRLKDELVNLLKAMETKAKKVKATDPARYKLLSREARAIRNLNGL